MLSGDKQATNQSFLRKRNKNTVLQLLYQRPQSYSDLARKMKLSNTAIAKIVDDLIARGLVVRMNKTLGRNGIYLSISPELGCLAAVDLACETVRITLTDMAGKVYGERILHDVFSVREKDLEAISDYIRSMLNDCGRDESSLKAVSIASPGKIDKKTGTFILAPRFKCRDGFSLSEYFSARFGCDVIVKNDINLALEGENEFGFALEGCRNVLMLHIDVGVGSALMFNGKLYEGSRGFAGEIGYYTLNAVSENAETFAASVNKNNFDTLSLFALRGVPEDAILRGEETSLKNAPRDGDGHLHLDYIREAFLDGDPLMERIMATHAEIVAAVAKNLSDMLDVDCVILNGGIIKFGKKYLALIKKYIDPEIKVCCSDLGENAATLGAIKTAAAFELTKLSEK